MGRKSKNSVRSELVASRHHLALFLGGLDVFVDLQEIGGFTAHAWAIVNDLYLQFFGGLIDDGHWTLLALGSEMRGDQAKRQLRQRFVRAPQSREINAARPVDPQRDRIEDKSDVV